MPAFAGVSFSEMFMIGVVAIIIWGKELPRVMKRAGQAYARLRRHVWDIRSEIERAVDEEDRKHRKYLAPPPPAALPAPEAAPPPAPPPAPPEAPDTPATA